MDASQIVVRLALSRALAVSANVSVNTAIVFTLYARTSSTAWVSGYFLVTMSGYGILMPLGGALADRFDRRRLIVAAEVAAAATLVVLAFVSSPAAVLAVSAVLTLVSAPVLPASRAALPNLVPEERLTWANGVIAQSFGLSITLGPIVGGALVDRIGARGVLLIAAATYLVGTSLVWSIQADFSDRATTTDEHGGVMAGLAFLWREPVLRAIVIAEVVSFSGVGFAMVADAPLAREYDVGAIGYGALIFTWGAGMLLGSLVAGRIKRVELELPAVVYGMAAMGVGLGLVWFASSFGVILGLLTLGGFGMGTIEVARQGVMQRRTPDEVRGRLFAAAEAVGSLSWAASFVAAGVLVGRIGAQPSYSVAGLTFLVGSALVVALIGLRVLRPVAAAPTT